MSDYGPTVGRIVHVHAAAHDPELLANGAPVVPAIITRVWNDECVNLTIFPDEGLPVRRNSVMKRLAVEAENPGRPFNTVWDWPPRA